MYTSKELLQKAAQHVAQARAINKEFAGKAMPAEAATQMNQHLEKASGYRRDAELKGHEEWLSEPQYTHDMTGSGSGGFAMNDTQIAGHVLAMPDDLPEHLWKSRREGGGFFWSADAPEAKAALTTSLVGTATTFRGTTPPPALLLHAFAGVSPVPTDGIKSSFTKWTLPTGTTGVGESADVSEYDDATAGTLTQARFGRWTELSKEAGLTGTADLLGLHRLAIARDLNGALISALTTAHGTVTAFAISRDHMLRLAVATVAGNLGIDPTSVTLAVNATDFAELGFAPSNGSDVGSVVVRYAGAQLFVTPSVAAGFAVAFHPLAVKYYEASGLEVISTRDAKSAETVVGTHLVGGYGVGLAEGVSYVDLVTG